MAPGSRNTKLGRDTETASTTACLPVLDLGWRVGVVEARQAHEWATAVDTTLRALTAPPGRAVVADRGRGGGVLPPDWGRFLGGNALPRAAC
ncbi:hypothetical protein ACIGBH_25530 [Streptomyces sp. NPDC085929]|uniref:hypothetical protein n=1 Tax=Streptomyces sp. NPDC085929 TaxID=3365739 RepID=UPI0037D561AA